MKETQWKWVNDLCVSGGGGGGGGVMAVVVMIRVVVEMVEMVRWLW